MIHPNTKIILTKMDAKVYTTIKEMLDQRGWIDIIDDDGVTFAEKGLDRICVFYNTASKFNIDKTEEYMKILADLEIGHAIVVYKNAITPMAKRVLETCTEFEFEIFLEEELMYNITKHRLVPKHTLLTIKQAHDFKAKFGTSIPTLLKSDPVARFYGYKRGDVVKVERGEGVCFRIVK